MSNLVPGIDAISMRYNSIDNNDIEATKVAIGAYKDIRNAKNKIKEDKNTKEKLATVTAKEIKAMVNR